MLFNLRIKGKKGLYAWSCFNFKRMEEEHKPLEVVIIISKESRKAKQFTYLNFKQIFEEI